MSSHVWQTGLQLVGAVLDDAFASGQADLAYALYLGVSTPTHPPAAPIALRWSVSPYIGLPRAPFAVYRRSADRSPFMTSLPPGGATPIDGWEWFEFPAEQCELLVRAVPSAGFTLTLEALNADFEVIPGQRLIFTADRTGQFRVPGIAGLRIHGMGTLVSLAGVDQQVLANAGDWELLEQVGLPFAAGEAQLPTYSPAPQGRTPANLAGLEAAQLRLLIDTALQLPLPGTGVVDIPTPAWSVPDVNAFLAGLRASPQSLFPLLVQTLQGSDDQNQLQVNQRHQTILPGIHQPGFAADPNRPANVTLAQTGIAMLAVIGDGDTATALGFGTIDFPPPASTGGGMPPLRPDGAVDLPWDYMVRATFVLPIVGSSEAAAIVDGCSPPQPVEFILPTTIHRNRPIARDQTDSETVSLQWPVPPRPQSYLIAASRASATSQMLNRPRPAAVGGYDPYLGLQRAPSEGDPNLSTLTTYVDHQAPAPLLGSSTSRYLVLARDVFGRWSPSWQLGSYAVTAPPVEAPLIHTITFVRDPNTAPIGKTVFYSMEVEFAWDWSDRSPDRVEFTGRFIPYKSTPDAAVTSGLALTNQTGPPSPTVVVKFDPTHIDSGGAPQITSGHAGDVYLLTNKDEPFDPDHPKYRLFLYGLKCDFGTAPTLAYEIYARAAESVRPNEPSTLVGPKLGRIDNPLAPAAPTLPTDLRWTALPDATHRARGLLSWPPAANIAGYVVWEATETALLHLLGDGSPDPDRNATMVARAATLQTLIAGSDPQKVLQGFSRLNTTLITQPSIELELPGAADGIYAYRVSTMSATGVESERSATVALLAVPRRNQPGQPRLMLFDGGRAGGIDVVVFKSREQEPNAYRYRIHRVQSELLLDNDVGLMGPPKLTPTDGELQNAALSHPMPFGEKGRLIKDPVAPSWFPYYYRVVAVSVQDLVNGEYHGESIPSAVQRFVLPPPELILDQVNLTQVVDTTEPHGLLTLRTNLPVKSTPLGASKVDVFSLVKRTNGSIAGGSQRQLILSFVPDQVTATTPNGIPSVYRLPPDQGLARFGVWTAAGVTAVVVSARDPLGRIAEETI